MRSSHVIALLIALAAAGWVASGIYLGDGNAAPPAEQAALPPTADAGPTKVRTRVSRAQPKQRILRLSGRTEAERVVTLRAETAGRVVRLVVEKGAVVKQGAVIARLAIDDREARLAGAKAELRQRELEFEAAQKLAQKNFRSQTNVAAAQAALEAAQARLKAIEIELRNIEIRAPFAGIIDDRAVEQGDFVDRGDPVATLVDLDPVLVVGEVPEHSIGAVAQGQLGQARFLDGRLADGVVRFVAATAEPATRTFRVELEVPNDDGRIGAGMTAELRLPLDARPAHRVSPAVLTLNDAGVVGVRSVDADGVVAFHPVEILSDESDAIWIAGLPDTLTLITVGQEWVRAGARVTALPEAP